MESEQRLWLFTLSALLIPGGLILWGVGAAHHVQWFGIVFAMGVIGITNTLGVVISISYCIDSYRELGGEAIVTVILIRNTMSFAMGYGSVLLHYSVLRLLKMIQHHTLGDQHGLTKRIHCRRICGSRAGSLVLSHDQIRSQSKTSEH